MKMGDYEVRECCINMTIVQGKLKLRKGKMVLSIKCFLA